MSNSTQGVPVITAFFDKATSTVSYVVEDPETKDCAAIDCVLDYDVSKGQTSTRSADKMIKHITQQGLNLIWLLEAHVHADHLSGAPYIQSQLGGKIAIGDQITMCKIFLVIYLMLKTTLHGMEVSSIT